MVDKEVVAVMEQVQEEVSEVRKKAWRWARRRSWRSAEVPGEGQQGGHERGGQLPVEVVWTVLLEEKSTRMSSGWT